MTSHIPNLKTVSECIELLNYITERTENVEAPMSILSLAREFKEKSGAAETVSCLSDRIHFVRTKIQSFEHMDTNTKVRMMFVLSASVNANFLKELEKDAFVEVDEKNRITHYKANNGSLELRGDRRGSAKTTTAKLKSNRSNQKFIRDYFEKKNKADVVPDTEEEKEMWNFIEFITEKCGNVNYPLNITQLRKDFNMQFGLSRSLNCIQERIRRYHREIQTLEFSDTPSKVKQLFGLSATLNSNFLTELRKDAVVDVDDLNRITKYTSNDGRLTLHGDHSSSAKQKLGWIEWRRNKKAVKKHCLSADADDDKSVENYCNFLDIEIPDRNCSKMSIDSSFDLNPPTEKSHRSEGIETREFAEEVTNPEITENAVTKTRSGRLSKRRHLDSNFSYDLANSSGALISSNSSYSKPAKQFLLTERSHVSEVKNRNKGTTGFSSSKQIGSFSNDSMRPNELDDYDPNDSIDDQVKLEPFRGSIQEDLDEFEEDQDIQLIPKPHQEPDEHKQVEEVPIKVEPEEPKMVDNPTEDVKPEIAQAHDEHKELIEFPIKVEHEEPVETKPETYHNSKIKFFEAMHSLILCFDTPILSDLQSKVHQKIQEIEGSDEVILNNEIALIIDLLISRISNQSVVNFSGTAESVNLSNFLCYLKAAILNSKMNGVDELVKNISELIEESQNKRSLIEEVANALRATLDINGF